MDKAPLDDLIARFRGQGAASTPSVDPLDPVIRSGDQFILSDPEKRGNTAETQDTIRNSVSKGILIGTFIEEWGFSVPRHKSVRFRRWLLDNEARLAGAEPPEVHYKGTYAVVYGSDPRAGNYRTIWVFDSMRGFQNFGQGLAAEQSDFSRLIREMVTFSEESLSFGQSNQLLQPAAASHRI